MEYDKLIRRAEDLAAQCEKRGTVTHTGFLSPAERCRLESRAKAHPGPRLLFHGGAADCERSIAFFLPDWMDEETLEPGDYICAIRFTSPFGRPGHRDYLGALLGMGIGREWLGDILVAEDSAWVFCQKSVLTHLLGTERIGRTSVKAEEWPLAEVPVPERKRREKSFSVMSPRLDAVVGGLFDLSRSEAARQIEAGAVSVNYEECLKTDLQLKPGDILSLRGKGKAVLTGTGGTSRKGRLFLSGEIYL